MKSDKQIKSDKLRETAKAIYEKMAEAGVPTANAVDAVDIGEAAKIMESLGTDEALCILFALLLKIDRKMGVRIAAGVKILREGGFI